MLAGLADVLSNLALGTAAVAAILVLVDWLLGEKQKAWLADAALRTWNWIDDAKGTSLYRFFVVPKVQFVFSALISLLNIALYVAILFVAFAGAEVSFDAVIHSGARSLVAALVLSLPPICIVTVNLFAVRRIMNWLSDSRNILFYVGKAFLIALPLFGLSWASIVVVRDYIPDPDFFDLILVLDARVFLPKPWLKVMTYFLAFTLMLVTFMLFSLAYILLIGGGLAAGSIYFVSGVLFVAEFVSRRAAEYPKGPVLAASALAGGIAGLIKVFLE
jgi:hypothetical protein